MAHRAHLRKNGWGYWAAFVAAVALLPVHAALADPARVGEPHQLLGKRLVFTNWIYVRPGDVGWTDQQGQSVFADESVKMGAFDAVWAPTDRMPWGIRLMAQKPAEIRKW